MAEFESIKPTQDTDADRVSQRDVAPTAIKDRHIENFTFDKAVGGTLTLGGVDNGDGQLNIKDSNGNTIIYGDNTGIRVTQGASTTIIDGRGIVSTANFQNAEVTISSTNSITSTSFTDYPGASLTPLVLERSRRILFYLSVYGRNMDFPSGSGRAIEVQIYDTFLASSIGVNVFVHGEWTTDVDWDTGTGLINSTTVYAGAESQTNINAITATAGTHTYKARWKVTGASTGEVYQLRIGYVLLGE